MKDAQPAIIAIAAAVAVVAVAGVAALALAVALAAVAGVVLVGFAAALAAIVRHVARARLAASTDMTAQLAEQIARQLLQEQERGNLPPPRRRL